MRVMRSSISLLSILPMITILLLSSEMSSASPVTEPSPPSFKVEFEGPTVIMDPTEDLSNRYYLHCNLFAEKPISDIDRNLTITLQVYTSTDFIIGTIGNWCLEIPEGERYCNESFRIEFMFTLGTPLAGFETFEIKTICYYEGDHDKPYSYHLKDGEIEILQYCQVIGNGLGRDVSFDITLNDWNRFNIDVINYGNDNAIIDVKPVDLPPDIECRIPNDHFYLEPGERRNVTIELRQTSGDEGDYELDVLVESRIGSLTDSTIVTINFSTHYTLEYYSDKYLLPVSIICLSSILFFIIILIFGIKKLRSRKKWTE